MLSIKNKTEIHSNSEPSTNQLHLSVRPHTSKHLIWPNKSVSGIGIIGLAVNNNVSIETLGFRICFLKYIKKERKTPAKVERKQACSHLCASNWWKLPFARSEAQYKHCFRIKTVEPVAISSLTCLFFHTFALHYKIGSSPFYGGT